MEQPPIRKPTTFERAVARASREAAPRRRLPVLAVLAAFALGVATGAVGWRGRETLNAAGYALAGVLNPLGAPLEATRWDLVELGTQRWRTEGGRPYLIFRGAGVGGFNGCTTFRARAQVVGNALRVTDMVIPPQACPPGSIAPAFEGMLMAARTLDIDGKALELRDGNGRTLARFRVGI